MSEKEKEAIVEEQQQDISELLQIRRDKLAALQAEGNNPFFVNTCDKDISAQEIHDRRAGRKRCVHCRPYYELA